MRLSLETGSQPFFEPARALYLRHGFAECEPFADAKQCECERQSLGSVHRLPTSILSAYRRRTSE